MEKFKKSGVVTFEECIRRQLGPHLQTAGPREATWTHLYLASGAGKEPSMQVLFDQKYKNILISYFYLRLMLKKHGGSMKEWIEANGWDMHGVRLMMDSGAYSAKTQNKPIPHKDYLDFLQKNMDYISIPIMMDEVLNPEQTKQNWMDAQSTGIKFMYAFHRPEPWKYLDWALENSEYVGLAPMPKSASSVKVKWFSKCLYRAGLQSTIGLGQGRYIKNAFHLLGSGAKKVLTQIDACSADASSWSMMVGVHATTQTPYGTICWFAHRTDKSNNWANIDPLIQDDIMRWIRTNVNENYTPEMLIIPEGVSMNWTRKNSPNLPLARINIENAKRIEYEANFQKKIFVPENPDFEVIDNEQMEGIKWG